MGPELKYGLTLVAGKMKRINTFWKNKQFDNTTNIIVLTSSRAFQQAERNDQRINQKHIRTHLVDNWTYQKGAIGAQLHIQLTVRHHL
jgi:hypothetical protein